MQLSLCSTIFAAVFAYSCYLTASSAFEETKPDYLNAKLNPGCGNLDDVASRVEKCASPLVDIIRGTVQKWPRNEKDAGDLCESFGTAEKCIKDEGRRCTKGLQRTIIATLGTSINRARKRECNKSKLKSILNTTLCVEKYQMDVQVLVANVSARIRVIEKQMKDLDEKTNGVCCMVYAIENEIKGLLEPKCKAESEVVISLYRSVLEDVTNLICRSPKCKDIFNGYRIPPAKVSDKDSGEIIAMLLRIVFSLG